MSSHAHPIAIDAPPDLGVDGSLQPDANQSSTSSQPALRTMIKKKVSFQNPTAIRTAEEINRARGIMHNRPDQDDLPKESMFPIQIGSELFRLSGASIMSDGPSYFTSFFQKQVCENSRNGENGNCNNIRTLNIDRDPAVFQDIARHLQGYYIKPLDGIHYVRLFADAQFYYLPRLTSQLFNSETFIQIGERHFQVPKDIFSAPDDSPNFFTLGFANFFANSQSVFPGLDRAGLLRPPPIEPAAVPTRSAEIFAQILHLLRGYPLKIRDEEHREELLRDVRYFHLRGLEQKLIPQASGWDEDLGKPEIMVRLEDVKSAGFVDTDDKETAMSTPSGWVFYAKPFGEDKGNYSILVLEIARDMTTIEFNDAGTGPAANDRGILTLRSPMREKFFSHIGWLAKKMKNVGKGGFDETLRFRIPSDAHVVLDGQDIDSVPAWIDAARTARQSKKRRLEGDGNAAASGGSGGGASSVTTWRVRKGQWRLRFEVVDKRLKIGFWAVKIEAVTGAKAMNVQRAFLS